MKRALRPYLLGGIAMLGLAQVASAETLRDAMMKAYQTNPTLNAARANQRANDETSPIARARGLPTLDGTVTYNENLKRSANSFGSPKRILSTGLNLSVPIYQGGSVKNSLAAAEQRIAAGQASLRDIESTLFSQTVAAYMDVIRDEAIVGLNQKQVKVLTVNLEATRDRFEVGDLTRTDIAQSESRLATADSQLRSGEAQLIVSREQYIRLVGNAPGELAPPPPLPNLPASPDIAVSIALEKNPDLLAAKKTAQAAKFDINVARAARLPRLSAFANADSSNFLGSLSSRPGLPPFEQKQLTSAAGLQATVPLFQGGGSGAQIRQAQARSSQALEQIIEAERSVVAQTRSAYASWRSSNAVIASSETAVSAASLSLEGVRAENSVGNRSILDILNAEQELLNAQVQLVSARRNAYVAGFTLLAAMGQAEARDLGLDGGTLYDPQLNADRVRSRLWDWGNDPEQGAVSTRTIDTPAQNPAIAVPVGK
jgi:outer membrane protein